MLVEEERQERKAEAPPSAPPSGGKLRGLAIVLLALFAVIAYFVVTGIQARAQEDRKLAAATSESAVPTVSVVKPSAAADAEEVILPGNMQAFTETPIWARASGYLRKWYVDIGARVHAGQLLADIEAPEVDHQLQQAKEQLVTTQENLKLAEITADRYQGLLKQDSIAKQDVDTAVQNLAARSATVRSAQANVARLQQMVGYEKVYAPFDGVITARNTDVGALIDAGTNSPGKELFREAATHTLRVYVSVPEVYSRAAQPGITSHLTLTEFPGRKFAGKIVRNSRSIDMSSRTLLVEVDVPNPGGELLPGSYASVHLKLPSKVEAVTVPANTLLFRAQGLQVAKVTDGKVALTNVTIGHDYGDSVELVHGISPADQIIVNPSDSIANGQKVTVSAAPPAREAAE